MRRDRGYVMISVLWILAILTIVTIGFGRRSMLEQRAAYYALDQSQALMMARGAVHRGMVEVRNKMFDDLVEEGGRRPETHLGQKWAQPMDLLAENVFEPPGEGSEDFVGFFIEDAESKIDINSMHQEIGGDIAENIPSLSSALLRKIRARLFERGLRTGGGGPFQAIEELRYLGAEEDEWYGEDDEPGLRELLTTEGGGRINLNTAGPEVLQCIPDLNDAAIAQILAYRAGPDRELHTRDDRGFSSVDELVERTQIDGDPLLAIQKYCTFRSRFFKITGIATRRQGTIRATCVAMIEVQGPRSELLAWWEGNSAS